MQTKTTKPHLLIIVAIFTIASCDYIKNFDKPHLDLIGSTPYQLSITEFPWGYGVTSINQFNGDFDRLDEKVYNLLKDKSGTCQVYLEQQDKDKYGQSNSVMKYIGDINIGELNKYQDWKYWQKESGIRTLIYKRYIKPSYSDSLKIDTIKSTTAVIPIADTTMKIIKPNVSVSNHISYTFSIDDLYPSETDLAALNQHRYVENGTIGDVNFTNGVFIINTNEGEQLTIQFSPSNVSSNIGEQLLVAFKPGNKIKSICARAGASTLDLVSAKIISQH